MPVQSQNPEAKPIDCHHVFVVGYCTRCDAVDGTVERPSPNDPFPALAEMARIRSERRIKRMSESMAFADLHIQMCLVGGRQKEYGQSKIRSAYEQRDELLRFVRSILANDFEGKECAGNCTHLDELGYEYDEPHLLKLDAGLTQDVHLSIVDGAGDLLDELGLARVEA